MTPSFDNWINENLNNLGIGILILLVGLLMVIVGKILHKRYNKYKLFKPFKREGKTEAQDNFYVIMHTRTLISIYFGYGFIMFGLYKILQHFNVF